MASTIWKGHLTFGLISIPIKLVRAGRAEKVSFRQLHKDDATRVKQGYYRESPAAPPAERVNQITEDEPKLATLAPVSTLASSKRGSEPLPFLQPRRAPIVEPEPVNPAPIERSEIVKGYEYAKDQYVVISKEDLEKITPSTAREMQIMEFVHLADVDPIYFETSYYVSPDKAGEKAYALLFEALRKTSYVAVAQVAMHNREHVVIIRPGRTGIVLHMMFYEAEAHREDEYRTDTSSLVEKELKLASSLIEALAAPFEPEKYHDTYKEKLDALIAAKVAGEQTVESPAPKKNAPVVNIMEALERSLAQSARKPASSAPAATAPVAESPATQLKPPRKRTAGGK